VRDVDVRGRPINAPTPSRLNHVYWLAFGFELIAPAAFGFLRWGFLIEPVISLSASVGFLMEPVTAGSASVAPGVADLSIWPAVAASAAPIIVTSAATTTAPPDKIFMTSIFRFESMTEGGDPRI